MNKDKYLSIGEQIKGRFNVEELLKKLILKLLRTISFGKQMSMHLNSLKTICMIVVLENKKLL